jgi:hypothetical protein
MTPTRESDQPLFRAAPLGSRSAIRAFPLVRLFEAGLDQRRWNAFVRYQNRAGGAGGVMVIEDARGAAHAVFSWRVKPNMMGERVLAVTDAVLGSLPGRALCDALVDEITALARERECQAVEIELADGGSGPNRDMLVLRGFKLVGGSRLLTRLSTE